MKAEHGGLTSGESAFQRISWCMQSQDATARSSRCGIMLALVSAPGIWRFHTASVDCVSSWRQQMFGGPKLRKSYDVAAGMPSYAGFVT